jgi:hypothetical protein
MVVTRVSFPKQSIWLIASRYPQCQGLLGFIRSGSMRFTNDEAANAWLDKNYRPGFGLM